MYLNTRTTQEQTVFTPNFNLNYSYYLDDYLNISSGLSFNQFGENVSYNLFNSYLKDTTVTIVSDSARILSWDSINNVVYVMYETTEIDTNKLDSINLKQQFNNRHSYLTIPILLGYELKKNKWYFNLKTGLGISFLLKSKANYINYELTEFINQTSNKVLINFFFSPEIGYQITPKLDLNFSPQFILNTKNSISYLDTKQLYTNLGLNIGISYSFTQFKSLSTGY